MVTFAVWAWVRYATGHFTAHDSAFFEAESTFLLAATAILVVVFELEKSPAMRRTRPNATRRKRPPAGDQDGDSS